MARHRSNAAQPAELPRSGSSRISSHLDGCTGCAQPLDPHGIAKAVVLAGDCRGSAQWPSLGVAARQLAPVANRPVLFHHLDALVGAGVRQAAIVTDSTTGASIREAVGDGSDWGLELTHLEYDGALDVLASAPVAAFVGSSPVLVHQGDVLLRERLSALEDDFAEHDLDALIMCPRSEKVCGRRIRPVHHRPPCPRELRREAAALDDALERLRAAGARIGVREVDACIPCRGGAEELLEGNRRMLEQLAPDHHGERVSTPRSRDRSPSTRRPRSGPA